MVKMTKRIELIWEVPEGKEKEIIADIISLSLNHDEWDDDTTMTVLLSIDKWYRILPFRIKKLVDERRLQNYEIIIQEVVGLPI
jgi:hypothetical protein